MYGIYREREMIKDEKKMIYIWGYILVATLLFGIQDRVM